MADARQISPQVFDAELRELLRDYALQNAERLDELTLKAVKQLAKLTRQTAPRGKREGDEARPRFHTSIAYRKLEARWFGSNSYLWFVKAPNYRLTHLIAKARRARNHRVIPGNPFLQNALDTVLREYEEDIRRYITE